MIGATREIPRHAMSPGLKPRPTSRRSLSFAEAIRWRRLLLLVIAVAVGSVGNAAAQGLGYAIVGPARVSGFFGPLTGFHFAGGGELLAAGRAGVGGEIGLIGNSSSGLIVTSVNGVFHLLPVRGGSAISPFVTGGYTHMGSGEGGFGAWNVGGGTDVWLRGRLGLRLELRDQVRSDFRGNVHYWTVRAGAVFR